MNFLKITQVKSTHLLALVTALLIASALFVGCAKKLTYVTIGTGGVTGVYYPAGGAISRMINKQAQTYGIKATVESTAGSVYNINAVVRGDLDFGIAQSDRQYQAVNGIAEWQGRGPQKKLRSVFALHPESITLIASTESGINSIEDLKNKRVNIGNPGSGQLQNSKDVLAAYNISLSDFQAEQVKAVEAPGLLQDGRIDAFFYTVGHPNGNIKETSAGKTPVKFIPITGRSAQALIKNAPYYTETYIPKLYYPKVQNDQDVTTIGVRATLVTSEDVSEEIVYAMTKEIFENLKIFKNLHQSFYTLTKKSMTEGLSAPLHKGAERYYKEVGLL